jgi:hypothetical protein
LVLAIRDLADRLDLIAGVHGVGLRTAVAILARISEWVASVANRPPPSPGLVPMTTTAVCDAVHGTSKADASACGKVSTLPAVFYWNAQLKAVYKRIFCSLKCFELLR